MIDRAAKTTARRTMGKAVTDHDVDRLMNAARDPGAVAAPVRAPPASEDDFAARMDRHRAGYEAVLADGVKPRSVSVWDIPVFILYACLGVFTRIWTDVTLYFDFGDDNGFQTFAIGVSMALHGLILATVANAWRAKWEIRVRNLLAMSALAGYLGFRLLTQL